MLPAPGIKTILFSLAAACSLLLQCVPAKASGHAVSIGVVSPVPAGTVNRLHFGKSHKSSRLSQKPSRQSPRKKAVRRSEPRRLKSSRKKSVSKAKSVPAIPPQDEIKNLSQEKLAPGVVHKCHRGALNINILDVDLQNPEIEVRPVLAGDSFNRLDEVQDQARKVSAIAAVNANYFKKDGTPLGTLVVDGEWIAGPLYDRISFGMTAAGEALVDRANLHGTIESSNPEVACLWVNNINQPRRTGSKLIAYTRRWGPAVRMAYAGCLVAVDASGRVVDTAAQKIGVPYGGFVLSDSKKGAINKLRRGDLVFLEWHHKPQNWSEVVQAVSGGPALIKNGKLFVDLKDENFKNAWTASSIHARTVLGVTAEHHLILATIEGPHTLWDAAKMLQRLGCCEAMNLDGGGSTTMVLNGKIVTRNRNTYQRRVAASLAVMPRRQASMISSRQSGSKTAQNEIPTVLDAAAPPGVPLSDPIADSIDSGLLALPANNCAENAAAAASPNKLPVAPAIAAERTDSKPAEEYKKSVKFGWIRSIIGK